jgi:hypothetical protein
VDTVAVIGVMEVATKVATRVVAVMMSIPVVGMMMVGIDVIVAQLLMLMLPVKSKSNLNYVNCLEVVSD